MHENDSAVFGRSNCSSILRQTAYEFLQTDKRLGKRLAYLTISGSIAYGTNQEDSDLDLRGFAVESRDSLLLGNAFEQVEDRETDTVVYGLRKFFGLLAACNPNTIEMLGTKPEHVVFMTDIGKLVREHVDIFLSKRAYQSFAGYATDQLRRLQNALAHDSYPEEEKERHILASIQSMMLATKSEYGLFGGEASFEILPSEQEDRTTEICISLHANQIPLRRFLAMNSALSTMLRNYGKLNHRNRKKDERHLRKHAMHLVRLYLTGIDILEGRGIHTYREKDLSMLRDIRSGKVSFDEVFRMADGYRESMQESYQKSKLPDSPDIDAIHRLLLRVYHEMDGA